MNAKAAAPVRLDKDQARRALLMHQGLYGDFEFRGKEGIMAYIRRVGCIQFDPLNVVGMNPELVLQSRIDGFDRTMLPELLYEDRVLIDYWDKNMAISPIEDWPNFERHRRRHGGWCEANPEVVARVRADVAARGHLSSADLPDDEKVDWAWGPTRLSRAALEGMYHAGQLVIHHKAGTRKFYDLAERHVPEALHGRPDPFETDEAYLEWYVLRRIGSVGLLWNRPSDAWLGIGLKSEARSRAFAGLLAKGLIFEVQADGLPHSLYMRESDRGRLDAALAQEPPGADRTCVLAPLDNALWDRVLVKELFGFEYRWEVYKPAAERQYGYYVLPVLYGDRIVARFEPDKQRRRDPLTIKNWWWEDGVEATEAMLASIRHGLERFAAYLGTRYERGRTGP